MKLLSFCLPSPMGSQIRTGAIDAAGGIVGLAGAFRALLIYNLRMVALVNGESGARAIRNDPLEVRADDRPRLDR